MELNRKRKLVSETKTKVYRENEVSIPKKQYTQEPTEQDFSHLLGTNWPRKIYTAED